MKISTTAKDQPSNNKLANPHDLFFKSLVGRRKVAVQFLKSYLPVEVTAAIDWRTLERVDGSFVTEELSEHFSDLIFRVKLKKGEAVYVYVLLEHKSTPEKWVALQLLDYIVGLWQRAKDSGEPQLPIVIPVVFYHGRRHWNIGTKLSDLMPEVTQTQWRRFVPDFEYHLCDLSSYEDKEIVGASGLQSGLLLLKHIFGGELEHRLTEIIKLLPPEEAAEQLLPMVRYISAAADGITPDEINDSIKAAFSNKSGAVMQTAAQIWMEQGRTTGILEGRKEGRQEEARSLVLRSLTRLFGELTPRLESRIGRLSLTQLELLSEELLEFEAIADLNAWLRANPPAPTKKAKKAKRRIASTVN
ncbi:MAG: Rpn family recombination-promoting nuclease/putative transposase [Acidobacteriota bacterium]|nr:Rpn family recombination-promoting nuclease/putative transposase [Acidobacteriota bacterium]